MPFFCGDRAALPQQPAITAKIPFSTDKHRRPANIPLHTLSAPRQDDTDSASLLGDHDEKRDSLSADSDFSLWSDTGDLVDQLADEEDPLRIRLRQSLEGNAHGGASKANGRQKKRAHFHPDEGEREKPHKAGYPRQKEEIPIPNPPRKPLSRGHRILATIMAPNDGPSRIHGLHGKKLM